MMDRRGVVASFGLTALGVSVHAWSQEPVRRPRPDPQTFESGDIIWPKKPGVFVPYASRTEERSVTEDEALWRHERNKFTQRARSGQLSKTQEEDRYWKRVADEVEQMDFSSFYHKYMADMSPDEFITFGGGNILYLGHVGIIDVDANTRQPYVIEAKWGMGVIQMAYDEWLQEYDERGDILVWHARLKEQPSAGRSSIVAYAERMIGRPYDFWNFDLSDESGFYCSKLVWRSVQQGVGVPLDDEVNSRRFFWYSPLQVMKSAHIQMLSSPGNYRNV